MIKGLDHGYVRLVDYMGSDLSVVRSARVSYDAEWRAGQDEGKDAKLINYLIKNRHTSPLESVVFTFEVKCPIFVARQWMRHRTWAYNEISARYAELPEEYYVPEPSKLGTQSKDNKQMRSVTDDFDLKTATMNIQLIEKSCKDSFEKYHQLISAGVPRELARSVLPVATYTKFFATVNLHNLFHFIKLRSHEHAQYEIQVYSDAMLELITPIVPHCVEGFKKWIM